MLTPAKELSIRTFSGSKIASVTNSTFIRRPMIDSKQDWVELLGNVNVDNEYELRYCLLDLLQFTDSDDEGCDDDPVVNLLYRVTLFHQYKESRSDDSNSTDDFIAAVLNLRNLYLNANRAITGVAKAESLPLTQEGFILLGVDAITGAYGHSVSLLLPIEIQ